MRRLKPVSRRIIFIFEERYRARLSTVLLIMHKIIDGFYCVAVRHLLSHDLKAADGGWKLHGETGTMRQTTTMHYRVGQ